MDELGDYIYIIAIVIAGLSSLLKKRRKPEENTGRDENRMPDLGDVLTDDDDDDFLPRMEPAPAAAPARNAQVYVKEVYKPMERKQEQAPLSYETVADYMKLKAKRTVRPVHYDALYDDMLQPTEEPDLQIDLETADDAKRAFVYAEIFNRKY